jgi:hypothetical protein
MISWLSLLSYRHENQNRGVRRPSLCSEPHITKIKIRPLHSISHLPFHRIIKQGQCSMVLYLLRILFLLTIITPRSTSFSTKTMLTPRTPADVQLEIKDPVDPTALTQSKAILAELRPNSDTNDDSLSSSSCNPKALLTIAKRLGDIPSDNDNASYMVSKEQCQEAFDNLSPDEKQTLLNIHQRVKLFAEAQRKSVWDMSIEIPGGRAGHTVSPCRGTFPCCFFSHDVC